MTLRFAQAGSIAAMDFFYVDTVFSHQLYALFFIEHGCRCRDLGFPVR